MTAQQDGGLITLWEWNHFRHGIIDSDPMQFCETQLNAGQSKRCTCGKYFIYRPLKSNAR